MKRDSLSLHINPEERGLAGRQDEEALLDRVLFPVSPEAYAEFPARLNAPPQPNHGLRRTMQTPAPWDREPALAAAQLSPGSF